MASRLALRSAAVRTALVGPSSRHVAAGILGARAALLQKRTYAAEKSRPDPKVAAESLINSFPGETLAAKSGSVLLMSSVAAFLLSKEIWLFDAEVFEMACIFGAYYVWYSGGKEGAAEYFRERKATIKRVLENAREEHKVVVQERINHIGKMSDLVDVTKNMFEMSKEIAKLEAEAYELKQKVAFTAEVKHVLDAWVRHEASVRESTQKELVSFIIEKIKQDVQDPKLQQTILQQTLEDVAKLAKA